jgi:hypothetical protein
VQFNGAEDDFVRLRHQGVRDQLRGQSMYQSELSIFYDSAPVPGP